MSDLEKKSIDPATIKMIQKAAVDGCETIFDRAEAMKPCPIGAEGSCCKNCAMGPCRVPAPKKRRVRRRNGWGSAARPPRRSQPATLPAWSRRERGPFGPCPRHRRGFSGDRQREVPEFKIKDEQSSTRLRWIWMWRSATALFRRLPSRSAKGPR